MSMNTGGESHYGSHYMSEFSNKSLDIRSTPMSLFLSLAG